MVYACNPRIWEVEQEGQDLKVIPYYIRAFEYYLSYLRLCFTKQKQQQKRKDKE